MARSKLKCTVLVLMLSFSGILSIQGAEVPGPTKAGPIVMADVFVNVTFQNGDPALSAEVYLYNCDHRDYCIYQIASAEGKVEMGATEEQLGPCYVIAEFDSLDLFAREPLYVEPGKAHYIDIVLVDELPSLYTLSGVVSNLSTGMPVDKAMVSINGYDAFGRRIALGALTLSDGSYSFTVPYTDSSYWIQARDPDGTTSTYNSVIYLNKTVYSYTEDIRLRSLPENKQLSFRSINSSSGKLIKHFNIHLTDGKESYNDHQDAPYSQNFTYNNEWANFSLGSGEYSFDLLAEVDIPFSTQNYVSTSFGVVMNDTPMEVSVNLPVPTGWRNITVNVTDSKTGEPLEGAVIYIDLIIKNKPGYDLTIQSRNITLPSGETRLYVPANVEFELRAQLSSYRIIEFPSVPAGGINDDAYVRISMEHHPDDIAPTGNLSVLVLDERTGIRIPDADVKASHDIDGYPVSYSTYSDIHGYANFTVPVDLYLVEVDSILGLGSLSDVEINDGQLTSVTVYLTQRKQYPLEIRYEYSFEVVDELGDKAPNVSIELYEMDDEYNQYPINIYTDSHGIARYTGYPGKYRLEVASKSMKTQTRSHYAAPIDRTLYLPVGGGILPDLVLYRTDPLEEVTGYVKDAMTGDPIQEAYVEAISFISYSRGTGMTRSIGPIHYDVVRYSQSSMTMNTGYYRNWGISNTRVGAWAQGYVPNSTMLDLGIGPSVKDFYLEPQPPFTAFVNGTLVNERNMTTYGYLKLFDLDREEYQTAYRIIESDGNFTFKMYPGRFLLLYGNNTEEERIEEFIVPEGGVHDLRLIIVPESTIDGSVTNWWGAKLSGVWVELWKDGTFEERFMTDQDGNFSIEVVKGNYTVLLTGMDMYDDYESDILTANGFNDFHLDVVLQGRTKGDLGGTISGNLPGMEGPVPDAIVFLKDDANDTIDETLTYQDGTYEFRDLNFGMFYSLYVEPPPELAPDEATSRSGYLPLLYGPFDLLKAIDYIDIELQFVEFSPPGHYNITSYSPTGNDVLLNEPIVIVFSEGMDPEGLEGNFSIIPSVAGMEFIWSEDNTTLTILHDNFAPNTTYTISVSRNLLSADGFRIWGGTDFEWAFTSGDTIETWGLVSSEVIVGPDRTVFAQASGSIGIMVYMVIQGVGSFELDEDSPGHYTSYIAAENFEWNHTYSYYFSNIENGTDLAPDLAGTFTTPAEPIAQEITSAEVMVDNDGDWHVLVEGTPGMTLYIVIDDVGSFLLEETSSGVYEVDIDSDNFNWEQEYSYHFSTSPGGAPLPGWDPYSDSLTMPKEPEEYNNDWCWYTGCCTMAFLILVLLLIIVLVFALARKKGNGQEE